MHGDQEAVNAVENIGAKLNDKVINNLQLGHYIDYISETLSAQELLQNNQGKY